MIAMIKGTVFAVGLDWIIIENQGIGYKVFFSRPEAVRLNQEVRVFTYQHAVSYTHLAPGQSGVGKRRESDR